MATRPVGLSRDLPAGRAMRALVEGRDIVVWRSASGRISAWDNRCPHRGMRLSHGFVRGEALACLYHGWHYGTDARCSYMPAHPDLDPPATITAQPCDVAERDGVIWVDNAGPATPATLPDGLEALRSLTFDAEPDRVAQALARTPLDGRAPDIASQTADLLVLTLPLDTGALRVAAALHPLSPAQTRAHLLAPAGCDARIRSRLTRWSETARRSAETGGGA